MRIGEVIIGVAIAAAIGMIAAAFLFVRNLEDDAGLSNTLNEPVTQEFETSSAPDITVESWRGAVTLRARGGTLVTVLINRTGTGETEQQAFDNLTKLESRAFEDEPNVVIVQTFRTNDAPAPSGTRAPIVIDAPPGAAVQVTATGPEPVVVDGFAGPIDVTAEGPVTIEVPPGSAFTLDAETQTGTINSFVDLGANPTTNGSGQSLQGSTGSNGPAITIRAGTGITIREG